MKTGHKVLLGLGALLSVTAMLLGPIAIAMAYRPTRGADQPNAPDWMEAWGALYGLVAASLAAIAAAAVYMQGKQAARVAEDRWRAERDEADLVGPRAVLAERVGPSMTGNRLDEVFVRVRNYSTQPIRRVSSLTIFNPDEHGFGAQHPVIGPNEEALLVFRGRPAKPSILSSGPHGAWDFDDESKLWTVELRFLDASGQAWKRVNNNEPTKVKSPFPGGD
ncbi:hypothetical protein [Actinoplanes sp. NPDC026670]|uniref:hypothetical protein n=1 Tax=Actinoplanes sp. NPDC026670 TaxID=3154700 RepID=UPI003404C70B